MNHIDTMKLALEAADELEWMLKSGYEQGREGPPRVHRLIGKIKALTEQPALAEQPAQQEPVAWGNFKEDGTLVGLSQHPEDQANWTGRKPLYTSPQPAQQWTDEAAKVPDNLWDGGCVLGHCGSPTGCELSDRCRADCTSPQAQPAQQQEPIAYAVYHRMGGSKSLHWSEQHSPDGDASQYQLVPLYTSPAQRKPLTDKQFQAIKDNLFRQEGWDGESWDLTLKEAIEAAHGIKENT